MSLELSWLIPDKILLLSWADTVTDDDMRILIEELVIILDAADQVIHSVIEMAGAHTFSDSIIYEYYQSPAAHHPQRGRIALVQPTFQLKVLADVVNRVSESELFHTCATREEACAFLLANDSPPPAYHTGYDQVARAGSNPNHAAPLA